ncbi:unnamed protein product [Moneuplotes crassus]|uniref:Uncharacterized protein n=1 Tax=Euplotes crassus TaxID=5936 RepID=A0AAD1UQC0_EUPCR|nr:unnamed protein product [Moneuplotes crassus]
MITCTHLTCQEQNIIHHSSIEHQDPAHYYCYVFYSVPILLFLNLFFTLKKCMILIILFPPEAPPLNLQF